VEDDSDRRVFIAELTNHPVAHLARNLLEKCGVESRTWPGDCGGLTVGQTAVQGGGHFVRQRHFLESKSILGVG
jgi:hypothetical protein